MLTVFDLLRRRMSRHESRHDARPTGAAATRDRARDARPLDPSVEAASCASRCAAIALLYLLLLLVLPVGMVFVRTFEDGLEPFLKAISRPAFQSAFWLTVQITAITVPINTVFGIITALAIVRRRFPGRGLLNAPHRPAVRALAGGHRPVAVPGLRQERLRSAPSWRTLGIRVIFAMPGMVLATIFVSLPFVVREVMPGAARDRHRPGGGRLHAGRLPVARPSGG